MTTTTDMTHAEVQKIRENAIFYGTVTRGQVRRLARSWLAQHHALTQARNIHSPIDAVDERGGARRKVCAGCSTDAGNWQVWPCPTVRALEGGGSR